MCKFHFIGNRNAPAYLWPLEKHRNTNTETQKNSSFIGTYDILMTALDVMDGFSSEAANRERSLADMLERFSEQMLFKVIWSLMFSKH